MISFRFGLFLGIVLGSVIFNIQLNLSKGQNIHKIYKSMFLFAAVLTCVRIHHFLSEKQSFYQICAKDWHIPAVSV